jgi:hypothetical protein
MFSYDYGLKDMYRVNLKYSEGTGPSAAFFTASPEWIDLGMN